MRPRLDAGRTWPRPTQPHPRPAAGARRRRRRPRLGGATSPPRRRQAGCPGIPRSRPEETPITIEIVALAVGLGIAVVFAVGAVVYARRAADQASQGRGVADTELSARQQSVEQEA